MTTKAAPTSLTGWYPLLSGLLAILIGALVGILVVGLSSPLKVILVLGGLCAAGGVVARAEWGLLVLAFVTYSRFSDVLVHSHGLPSVVQPLVLLLLIVILARHVLAREQVPPGWRQAALLLCAYGMVRAGSVLYAAEVGAALDSLIDYTKDAIIAVIVTLLLHRGAALRRVLWTLVGVGLFLGSVTAFQYVTGTFDNSYWGLSQALDTHIIGESSDFRAAGPIGDPNFFAQALLPLAPLALYFVLSERRWLPRLVAGWALAVTLLAILLTFSRGAFVALLVMCGLVLMRRRPRPRDVALALLLMVPMLALMPEQYSARVMTLVDIVPAAGDDPADDITSEVSFRGRASEIIAGYQMFAEHPILGVGVNNYPAYYQQYSRQIGLDPRSGPRAPHSLYLEVVAETGLLGLMVFSALLFSMYYYLRRSERLLAGAGRSDYAELVAALGIGITGYLFAAIFLHAAYPRFFWLLFGIAMSVPQVTRHVLATPDEVADG
jgi:putative inorganic carbon (hco3(-)) transporter